MADNPAKDEWTVLKMLEWATEYFEKKNIPQPRLSIEWLLAHVLECKRLDLYLKFDFPLTEEVLGGIKPLIIRRAGFEPLQYITGHTDFFGLKMNVNPDVLIPRPETEQLVELILENKNASASVLDIGTGSGCIPIALKTEKPGWDVSAFDISPKALITAKENAALHEADISFFQHDLHQSRLPENIPKNSFDFIVSNPPYIPLSEKPGIDREVRDFEPELALFHENIRQVYASVREIAENYLKPNGTLYLEIHENYGEALHQLFKPPVWTTKIREDYSDKQRFIVASFSPNKC